MKKLLTLYHEVKESLEREGFKGLSRKRIFRNRIATPVEMDLSKVPDLEVLPPLADYQFVEVMLDELETGKWSYIVPSRYFKAFVNLKKGWRDFALAKDGVVIGDLWCVTPGPNELLRHADLEMLGISNQEGEAYAFDMLIDPTYRGKNLAAPLQRALQSTLKKAGIRKVYGFYWDDNLPALWMHRMLKFKELSKRSITRFFFIQRARNAGLPAPKTSVETSRGEKP